jgi:hypothetical protein
MKSIILTLTFIFSLPVFAQTASKIPSLNMGGFSIPVSSNLKMITCGSLANYDTCRDEDNAEYLVPGGQQFRIIGSRCVSHGASGQDVSFYRTANVLVNSPTCIGCTQMVGHTGTGPGDAIHKVSWCPGATEAGGYTSSLGNGFMFYGYNGLVVPTGERLAVRSSELTVYGTVYVYGYEETP